MSRCNSSPAAVERPVRTTKPRTSKSRLRTWSLAIVHVAILAHVTQYLVAGRTISPVEPSEAMSALELGVLNAGCAFFGVAILSTFLFGRFFCGWGCHIVALQDLCAALLRRMAEPSKVTWGRSLPFPGGSGPSVLAGRQSEEVRQHLLGVTALA